MGSVTVRNGWAGWLALWLEPFGEDRWLRPGETLHVWSNHRGDDEGFLVEFWDDDRDLRAGIANVTVWIMGGDDFGVTDADGVDVECGHQRPAETADRWTATARAWPESRWERLLRWALGVGGH